MRYQSFLYTDAYTSPLYIGEISVFLIYRRTYLAVVYRRDTSLRYIQTHLPRRCTSARYQSFLYTDAYTSPLYIGEISVFVIYRRIYLAVVHRRDISLSYIQTHLPRRCISATDISISYVQTHLPRRCTSARYRSFLYTDTRTSPAVAHRGDISLSYIQTHVPRRCTSARRWFYIR